jgi:hypothetical protein
MRERNISFFKGYDFGVRKIIQALAKEFSLPWPVAYELYSRYVHFQKSAVYSMAVPGRALADADKEVGIKSGYTYFNLSSRRLNSFVRDFVKNEILGILKDIRMPGDNSAISFIGRLNSKKGFCDFLRAFVEYNIHFSAFRDKLSSSSFGCLKYGINRFLENTADSKEPLWRRIVRVYREYF